MKKQDVGYYEKLEAFLCFKQKIGTDEKISLYDFLSSIGCLLETKPLKKGECWKASIKNARVCGELLDSPTEIVFGIGDTADLAAIDYVTKLRGKVLNINKKYYPVSNGLYFSIQEK